MSVYVSRDTFNSRERFDRLRKPGAPPELFQLEVTARCNNNCRHCCINLPAGDRDARTEELSVEEIARIGGEAVELGVTWCLITGGEPLLRDDFAELYLALRRRGFLVTVFTNACLVTEQHVALFRKYPPRDLEVSVYGVTRDTYERVTRRAGSFEAFQRGLALLHEGGVKVRLKAMGLRSNLHELPDIIRFCRENTKDIIRFDPLLSLRYDGDLVRNEEIRSERLSATEIIALEQADSAFAEFLEAECDALIVPAFERRVSDRLFRCGAGRGTFTVSYKGEFRLCSNLWHPACTFDLRRGSLIEAWQQFVPRVLSIRPTSTEYSARCGSCALVNLCQWCPASAYLENGTLEGWSERFCQVAHARAEVIQQRVAEAGE